MHSRLHGHSGPAPRRGRGQASPAGALHPRLRARPIAAPHAACHTPPGDRSRGQAGLGLGHPKHPQPVGAERGQQTGSGADRQTERRTDGYASEPTGLPQKDNGHNKGAAQRPPWGKCACAGQTQTTTPVSLCAAQAAYSISQRASGHQGCSEVPTPMSVWHTLLGNVVPGARNRALWPRPTCRSPSRLCGSILGARVGVVSL